MEKLTKSVIKSIVKECLVEILSEGINGSSRPSNEQTVKKRKPDTKNRTINTSRTSKRNNKIIESAKTLTDDPIINELLVDTAQTTLREQVAADSKSPGALVSVANMPGADRAAIAAEKSSPEELFGAEAAGKWAQLAFDS